MNLFASFKQEALVNWMSPDCRVCHATIELPTDGRYLGCLEDKADTGQYDAYEDPNDKIISSHSYDDDKDLKM